MKTLKPLFFIFLLIPLTLPAQLHKVKVTGIVDGDTITVYYKGKKEKVRLTGIDTPESRYNYKTKRDSERSGQDIKTITRMGKRATRFVKSILRKGDTVKLEFDVELRDRYGRLLAYVYLADGRMLNEVIVKSGYASVMTYPPNVKYADRFVKAYRYARKNKLGLWK
ncbi:thermonuclease family protein [Spirochaetota bacterium]